MGFRRRKPLRLATPILVFDDDAHAHVALVVVDGCESPDAWVVHLHDHVRPLGDIQLQDVHRRWRRHGVAIQCDDGEPMARQCQRNAHIRARVQ